MSWITDLDENASLTRPWTLFASDSSPSGVDQVRIRWRLLMYSSFMGSRLVLRCVRAGRSNCESICCQY